MHIQDQPAVGPGGEEGEGEGPEGLVWRRQWKTAAGPMRGFCFSHSLPTVRGPGSVPGRVSRPRALARLPLQPEWVSPGRLPGKRPPDCSLPGLCLLPPVALGEALPPQLSGSLDPSHPFFVSLLRKSSSWGPFLAPQKVGWCLSGVKKYSLGKCRGGGGWAFRWAVGEWVREPGDNWLTRQIDGEQRVDWLGGRWDR